MTAKERAKKVFLEDCIADGGVLRHAQVCCDALMDGDFCLNLRGFGQQRVSFRVNQTPDNDCEWASHPANCKTIGDARTLCRLLGVELKE